MKLILETDKERKAFQDFVDRVGDDVRGGKFDTPDGDV
jgi:hypothetical protein